MSKVSALFAMSASLWLAASDAMAQSAPSQTWAGALSDLSDRGVELRFQALSTIEGFIPRDGSAKYRFGGKLIANAKFDLGRFAGLTGLSITARFEQNLGSSVNGMGGALLPFNTSMAFPGEGQQAGDLTAFYITQQIGAFSFGIGKFDMVSRATGIPLVGGGVMGGFRHLGLAAPATGVTPPYLFGAMATYSTPWATFAVIAYDAESAVRRDPSRGLFRNGATVLASATVPVTISDLRGYHGIKLVISSTKGTDLSRISETLLPDGARAAVQRKEGVWYAAYSFQQNLWQDTHDPKRAWGVYGQVSTSDSNPTYLSLAYLLGIGGTSPMPGRTGDIFGIGFFRYTISKDLISQLYPVLPLRDERGYEFYYNAKLTEAFRTTFSAQWVRPVAENAAPALVLGLRNQLDF